MARNYLFDFDSELTPEHLTKVGGKFLGLLNAKDILAKINEESNINIEIPRTFVLSMDAFDEIKADDGNMQIPEDIVNQAMQALVACGGNVAVRSTADVEDKEGQTHSGAFDTVLNVKNRAQMRNALQKVYASAQNVEDAKMAVIIQKMINKPILAGVAYSEDLNGDEKVVISYVENKTADKMIVGEEEGNFSTFNKHFGVAERVELLEPKNFNLSDEHMVFEELKASGEQKDIDGFFCHYALSQVTAVINNMEKKLKYPVDLEFAVNRNKEGKPLIYLLQEREYKAAPEYKINFLANGDCYGYKQDEGKSVEGEVVLLDQFWGNDANGIQNVSEDMMKDKIVIMNYSKKREDFATLKDFAFYQKRALSRMIGLIRNKKHLKAKCLIDRFDITGQLLRGHWGNQLREKGLPFYKVDSKAENYQVGTGFDDIKNGDRIKINLEDCSFKMLKKESVENIGVLKPKQISKIDIKSLKYSR